MEDRAPYGNPARNPSLARQTAYIEAALTTALAHDGQPITGLAANLAAFAAASGRPVESLTLAEIIEEAQNARLTSGWIALGKIDETWHAIGQGSGMPFIEIGKGRRRTFTAEQLATARRFPSALLARRAGRSAGFDKTFAFLAP